MPEPDVISQGGPQTMGQPKYAVNPSDGKVMRNDGSGWKPVQSAKNSQGDILINEGSGWVPVPSATGARPKMSIGRAMMTMGPQGRDWAMTDEAAGTKRLGGIPGWLDKTVEMSPMAAPINMNMGAIGLAMEAFGKPPKAYTEGRDEVRANVQQAREDRPVTAFASEVAGGGAYPMGGLKAGAPIIKESLKMAFLGLLQGGTYAYNASEGDTADRIESGKAGATVGGLIGAIIPGGSAAATPLLRSGKGTLAKGADMVGRVFGKDIGAEAGHVEQVARAAVQRSMERSKMTPEKVLEAIDKFGDKPAVLAEVIGQDAVNALTALTRAPGATAQKAQDIIAERFGGFAGRAADDLRSTTGLTDQQIAGNFDAEIAQRQAEAAPAYQSLFEQQGGVASPRLDQLSGTNTLKGKIANAEKAASDLAIAQGRDPASVSRLEVLDTAKRSLDDDIAKAVKNQDREEAMRLQTMQTALLNELDSLTGGQYAAARDLGGEAPRIISAFDQGTKAMRPSVSRNTVNQQTNALRPQDRPAYAAGVASKIDEDIANGRMAPQRFRLPANQQKVTAAFGEDAGGEFTKRMQAEAELRDLGARWGPRMNAVTGTVAEHSGSGADEGIRAAFALARGNLKEIALLASSIMRKRGFSEKERDAIGDLLLSNPEEGLRRLGVQLPAPGGGAPANALAPSTRGKPPEPNSARDPQNVRAQFEHPGDIESYDAAGNAKFKPGSKGEAMARGINALANNQSGFMRPDAAGTMMTAGGAGVGAMNPIDFDGDGKTSPQERAMTAALYGGAAYGVNRGVHGLDRLGRAPKGAATEFRVRPGESGSSKIQFRAGGERWADVPGAFGSEREAAAEVARLRAGETPGFVIDRAERAVRTARTPEEFWENIRTVPEGARRDALMQQMLAKAKTPEERVTVLDRFFGAASDWDQRTRLARQYLRENPQNWREVYASWPTDPQTGASVIDGVPSVLDMAQWEAPGIVDAVRRAPQDEAGMVENTIERLRGLKDSMTRPSGSNAGRDFNLETWSPSNKGGKNRLGMAMLAPTLSGAAQGGVIGGAAGYAGQADASESNALLEQARARVSELESITIPQIESDLRALEDPNADPMEIQRILQRRGFYDGKIDGVIGPQTRQALIQNRNDMRASIDAYRRELETARGRVAQLEEQAAFERTQAPAWKEMAREAGPLGGVLIGAAVGGLTRGRAVRSQLAKANTLAREANALLGSGPVSKSWTGANGLNQRVANVNQFWRLGGAGENVPFKTTPHGNLAPRAKPVEPSNLYKKPPRFSGTDIGVIGGGLTESGVSQFAYMDAKKELAAAQAAVEKEPNEANRARLERARDQVAIWDTMRRMGLLVAGGRAAGAFKKPYHAPPANIAAAEAERALLLKTIRDRK